MTSLGSLALSAMIGKRLDTKKIFLVRDGPKLPCDSGEVPISEWSGWHFDSRCEIVSLFDGKN